MPLIKLCPLPPPLPLKSNEISLQWNKLVDNITMIFEMIFVKTLLVNNGISYNHSISSISIFLPINLSYHQAVLAFHDKYIPHGGVTNDKHNTSTLLPHCVSVVCVLCVAARGMHGMHVECAMCDVSLFAARVSVCTCGCLLSWRAKKKPGMGHIPVFFSLFFIFCAEAVLVVIGNVFSIYFVWL